MSDTVEVYFQGKVRLDNFCDPDDLANMNDQQLRDVLADAMRGEVLPDHYVYEVRHLDPIEPVTRTKAQTWPMVYSPEGVCPICGEKDGKPHGEPCVKDWEVSRD